jgi:lipopolysaccharide/colanic/teichoic acid biosynthesis glycosyltransferase
MVVDAEAKLAELQAANERSGPLFKMTRDPRITPIGHFLRRTSIDELPQLLDVLRGDLSLVGPRPALPAEVAEFDEQLLGRLKVRPGITGLWQVEGRDKASFDVYRRLDLFYVENWSFALDVAILLDSVPAVLGRGLRSSDAAA